MVCGRLVEWDGVTFRGILDHVEEFESKPKLVGEDLWSLEISFTLLSTNELSKEKMGKE